METLKQKSEILPIALTGFLLNLIWENLQAPFYTGYTGFAAHFLPCLYSAFGDMAIIAVIFYLVIKPDSANGYETILKKIPALLFIGLVISVGIEKWALAYSKWNYTAVMPMVPAVNIGLLPMLQMLILPFLTFCIVRSFNGKSKQS